MGIRDYLFHKKNFSGKFEHYYLERVHFIRNIGHKQFLISSIDSSTN